MKNWLKYFLLSIIVLWVFGFLIIFMGNLKSPKDSNLDFENEDEDQNDLKARIRRAESDLIELQAKNEKNEEIIQELRRKASEYNNRIEIKNDIQNEISVDSKFPSLEFEQTRRKIFDDLRDVSYFINTQIESLKQVKDTEKLKQKIDFIKKNFKERTNVLIANSYNLSVSKGLGEWRKTESLKLANIVKKRFHKLQNPDDCQNKKKIICDMGKSCGFGCQMHHVMYCFITAYFTDRTMVLNSEGWRYNQKGFEAYFKPLSENCVVNTDPVVGWNENHDMNVPAIKMPIVDTIINKPSFLPLNVPKEFLESLKKFHGDPFVWWSGQILNYLMRFNSEFESVVNKHKQDIKFKTPCVGVHVRRTDKVGTEAAYHGLEEYMSYVKDFFDIYDLQHSTKSIRNVYLATDEISVLKEAKQNYKDYNFLLDETNAKTASLNQRYTPESAQGVILDIYHLSQCDYLVCTFSSQVCRMAYELMQDRFPDASWRFKSLDDVYYFGGQLKHEVIAIYDHDPVKEYDEIELKRGDLINLAGNHWNGYSKGRNKRTGQEGLFPTFKTMNVIDFY